MKGEWVEIAIGSSEQLWENLSQANGYPQQSLTFRGLVLPPCSVRSWEQWPPYKCHRESKDVTEFLSTWAPPSRTSWRAIWVVPLHDHLRCLGGHSQQWETGSERLSNLPEVIQLISGRDRIEPRSFCFKHVFFRISENFMEVYNRILKVVRGMFALPQGRGGGVIECTMSLRVQRV